MGIVKEYILLLPITITFIAYYLEMKQKTHALKTNLAEIMDCLTFPRYICVHSFCKYPVVGKNNLCFLLQVTFVLCAIYSISYLSQFYCFKDMEKRYVTRIPLF